MKHIVAVILGLSFLCTYSLFCQDAFWVPAYVQSYSHVPDSVVGYPDNPTPATGYLDSNLTNMKAADIDWTCITHVVYSAVESDSTGVIRNPDGSINRRKIVDVVRAAHAHGKPALLSIGGSGNWGFPIALTQRGNHATSMTDLIIHMRDTLKADSLDGWDIDLETSSYWDKVDTPSSFRQGMASPDDSINFVAFIRALRDSLNVPSVHAYYDVTKKPLLTGAIKRFWHGGTSGVNNGVERDVNTYFAVKDCFDRIFVMTYDFTTFVKSGGITWHNSNLYNYTGENSLWSADQELTKWFIKFASPSDKKKLCIGVDFNGYNWVGPRTPLGSDSIYGLGDVDTVFQNERYYWIVSHYRDHSSALYHWDPKASSPYLTLSASKKFFIPYEDQTAIQAKVNYARSNGLGGAFIWELGAGYRRDLPSTAWKDSLLKSVKVAAFGNWAYTNSFQPNWSNASSGYTVTPDVADPLNSSNKVIRISGFGPSGNFCAC